MKYAKLAHAHGILCAQKPSVWNFERQKPSVVFDKIKNFLYMYIHK